MNLLDSLRTWNRSRKWKRRNSNRRKRKDKLLSFGRFASGLLVDGVHGVFAVDPEDDFVARKLLTTGTYSEPELALATQLTPSNGSVLVVGTHIGALAIPLSRHCDHMIAVEANPRTFALLKLNLLLNGCHNVEAHNVAAADAPGKISFLLNRDNSGGSKRMPKTMDESYVYDEPEIAEVRAEALDSLLQRKTFDLIFMDIEGSEYFAMQGMPNILSRSKTLIVEFVPHHLRNVAGVGPEAFASLIVPHFDWMYLPKYSALVGKDRIGAEMKALYLANESHDGLVFLKSPLPPWLANSNLKS